MNTQMIDVVGNTLAVNQAGSGLPVLLLHGAFQTRRLWRPLMESLGDRHTLIAPDLRGLGDSGIGDARFDFQSVGAEMHALMRRLGHERFAVIGHDLGAGVAHAMAAQSPDIVSRLGFMDMLLPGFGFEEAWVPRPEGQFLWFAALNAVPGVIEQLLVGRERAYLDLVLRGGFTANKAAISDADLDAYAEAYAKPGALAHLGGYFRAMWTNADHVRASATTRLTMPVAAFGGQYSVGEGAAASMRAVADHVESFIVPDSGHWLPEENPAFVRDALAAFLA